jgi:hypothetical protein
MKGQIRVINRRRDEKCLWPFAHHLSRLSTTAANFGGQLRRILWGKCIKERLLGQPAISYDAGKSPLLDYSSLYEVRTFFQTPPSSFQL